MTPSIFKNAMGLRASAAGEAPCCRRTTDGGKNRGKFLLKSAVTH
jgi:hypothetical protein